MYLYVFGNGNLSWEDFLAHYYQQMIFLDLELTHFIVCDFRGVDTLVMEYLKCKTDQVNIYHIGSLPRYLPDKYKTKVSNWILCGGYETDEERDNAAIEMCTHFLARDFNSTNERKSGTQRNIEKCLALGKEGLTL